MAVISFRVACGMSLIRGFTNLDARLRALPEPFITPHSKATVDATSPTCIARGCSNVFP